jgi:hypothetical protein
MDIVVVQEPIEEPTGLNPQADAVTALRGWLLV